MAKKTTKKKLGLGAQKNAGPWGGRQAKSQPRQKMKPNKGVAKNARGKGARGSRDGGGSFPGPVVNPGQEHSLKGPGSGRRKQTTKAY
jgi:hypothetical protein